MSKDGQLLSRSGSWNMEDRGYSSSGPTGSSQAENLEEGELEDGEIDEEGDGPQTENVPTSHSAESQWTSKSDSTAPSLCECNIPCRNLLCC